jgi:putative phosphoesterase
MKKIALISDIHANFASLDAIKNDEEFIKCDDIILLGDAVGYYYDSEEVIRFLIENDAISILGNHDEDLLYNIKYNKYPSEEYIKRYGSGLIYAKDSISQKSIEWLQSLPEKLDLRIENVSILLCHSSPIKKNDYIYPDCNYQKRKELFDLDYDCIFMGHSHYQYVFNKSNQIIVNPGSIGQSREVGGYSFWAIIKIANNEMDVELKQTEYDVTEVESMAKKIDPDVPYIYNILRRHK